MTLMEYLKTRYSDEQIEEMMKKAVESSTDIEKC